jgi:branched-chain amino acid transport system substrate-binding protein
LLSIIDNTNLNASQKLAGMNMKYTLWLSLALLVVSCAPHAQEPIRIGFIGALTGPVAPIGEPARNAVALAVDEINTNGGINGRKLEVIYEDGQCDPKTATSAAQKLYQLDNVPVILGGHCTPETLAIASVAEANHRIVLASASSGPAVRDAGDYVFRTTPTNTQQGTLLARLVYTQGYRNAAVITEETTFAQPIADAFIAEFTALGGTITTYEHYKSSDTEVATQITKMQTSGADAVFYAAQSKAKALMLLEAFNEAHIDATIYGNDPTETVSDNPLAQGIIFGYPYYDENSPQYQAFVQKYKQRYNVSRISYEYYAAESYDAVYLIKDALEHGGEDPTAIKNYLYTIKNYEGASGPISFDDHGDVTKTFSARQVVNNKSVLYE